MKYTTVLSLRLPVDLAVDLTLMARCEDQTVSEAIRAAITCWIAAKRADPAFQEALRQHIEQAQRLQRNQIGD